jgi:hypothetical protein
MNSQMTSKEFTSLAGKIIKGLPANAAESLVYSIVEDEVRKTTFCSHYKNAIISLLDGLSDNKRRTEIMRLTKERCRNWFFRLPDLSDREANIIALNYVYALEKSFNENE